MGIDQGECVVDVWGGTKDAAGTPWERDTMSPSFSTTKGVATTLQYLGRLELAAVYAY